MQIGQKLRGGEVIELVSDLGGGKTTFVRGLARGMGSKDHVASPTFTISRLYRADALSLHHYDFYRLHEAGEITQELADTFVDKQNVTVIEWSNLVEHVLPNERLTVIIKNLGDDVRELIFKYPEGLEYLINELEAIK